MLSVLRVFFAGIHVSKAWELALVAAKRGDELSCSKVS